MARIDTGMSAPDSRTEARCRAGDTSLPMDDRIDAAEEWLGSLWAELFLTGREPAA